MFEPNVNLILSRLAEADTVLDIGGWALPFNRANYVLDAMPYATRGTWAGNYKSGHQGGTREYFTRDTWYERDICDHTPFPFADKSVDFVICSHTLEDIRDPIWVCQEMRRVGRRGYLEVPSRLAESSFGVEPGIAGWSHHRWLIDIVGDSVTFLPKYHMIHRDPRFHYSAAAYAALPEVERVQWLFWDDRFEFAERTIHGLDNIEAELAGFVARRADLAAIADSDRRGLLRRLKAAVKG